MPFEEIDDPIIKEMIKNSRKDEPTYFLYGSFEAFALLDESKEALMASDNMDYYVVKLSRTDQDIDFLTDLVPVERFKEIDEATFLRLHVNLCSKAEKLILNPLRPRKR